MNNRRNLNETSDCACCISDMARKCVPNTWRSNMKIALIADSSALRNQVKQIPLPGLKEFVPIRAGVLIEIFCLMHF